MGGTKYLKMHDGITFSTWLYDTHWSGVLSFTYWVHLCIQPQLKLTPSFHRIGHWWNKVQSGILPRCICYSSRSKLHSLKPPDTLNKGCFPLPGSRLETPLNCLLTGPKPSPVQKRLLSFHNCVLQFHLLYRKSFFQVGACRFQAIVADLKQLLFRLFNLHQTFFVLWPLNPLSFIHPYSRR